MSTQKKDTRPVTGRGRRKAYVPRESAPEDIAGLRELTQSELAAAPQGSYYLARNARGGLFKKRVTGSPQPMPGRCGRKLRNLPRYCLHHPAPGRDVCAQIHGGDTPVGVASPSTRTGRYSSYLPKGLRTSYERAMADPELLSLRPEVALVESRIEALVAACGQTGSGRTVKGAQRAVDAALVALENGPDERVVLAELHKASDLLAQAAQEFSTWEEIRQQVALRARLVDAETRKQQTITMEQALLLMRNVVSVVKENVRDAHVLAVLEQECLRLVS